MDVLRTLGHRGQSGTMQNMAISSLLMMVRKQARLWENRAPATFRSCSSSAPTPAAILVLLLIDHGPNTAALKPDVRRPVPIIEYRHVSQVAGMVVVIAAQPEHPASLSTRLDHRRQRR
ncbi:hypothetical protein CC2G_003345 [Coprinopsis cinerea AmutBmut pab1-1]|nr:hypothetical protein CC2G_003345 [Coprinopsis cinerea AmutBmut pab1-1]